MKTYIAVTDAELARARNDPVFRQKLLSQNLEALLAGLGRLRAARPTGREGKSASQIREGVELAVRLAELIQKPAERSRRA